MFKLHYAPIKLENEDIPCFEFKKHSEMIDFIDEKCVHRNGEVVFLIGKDDLTDVFVSESYISVQDFLSKKNLWQTVGEYFFQEYSSFEEAYAMALAMSEGSNLCYS